MRNADDEFTRLRQIFDREKREDGQAILASHLAKLPADIAWIERRTLIIRDALLTGMVNALLENGVVRADSAAAIAHFTQSGVAPSPALTKALVWCDILAEKFETARERIAALPPEDIVAATALGATIHFLTGRNSDAVASFREALKQLRKHTGRRKAVFPGAAGIFHVLSLLREHDTRLHGEIRNLLEAARGQLPWTGYQALCALFEVACGQDEKAEQAIAAIQLGPTDNPLVFALISLARLHIDSEGARRRAALDEAAFERIAAHLPLVGRIHADILAKISPQQERWRTLLHSLRRDNIIAFTDIIGFKPKWERALDRLTAFLSPAAAGPPPRRLMRYASGWPSCSIRAAVKSRPWSR